MKYRYFAGNLLMCEANSRVRFSINFPKVREEVIEDVVKRPIKIKKTEEPVNKEK